MIELIVISCLVTITAVVLVCVIALTLSTIREINQPLHKRGLSQDRIPVSTPKEGGSQKPICDAKGVPRDI